MTRARTIAAVVVASALLLAACGSSSSDSSSDGGGSGSGSSSGSSAKAPVTLDGKVTNKGTKDISADGASPKVDIELDDNYFSPTFIKAEPGAKVTIALKNEGSNQHTFTLDDGNVDKQLAPGDKAEVTVTVPDTGALRFSCNFHGGMGMQGAFYSGAGQSVGSGSGSSDGSTTTDAPSTGGY